MMRTILAWGLLLALLSVSAVGRAQTTDCPDDTRLITHALGETCVPLVPQRVVPLDMTITELLLIAERPPVAASGVVLAAATRMHPELEATFAALLEDGTDVGFPPNIEAILAVEPDLIIGPRDLFTEGLYPQLSAIAPTVLYDPAPGDWRSRLVFAGEVLGLSDTVEGLLADYDTRVAELQQALDDDTAATTVSLVRTFPGQVGLVLAGTNADAVIASVGLARPDAQAVDLAYITEQLDGRPELLISFEELRLADGDVVFVFGDATELEANPLWQAVPAVAEGRAFTVGYYWWGDSLLSAHDMLDDLFTYVVGAESVLANPFEAGLGPATEDDTATPTPTATP